MGAPQQVDVRLETRATISLVTNSGNNSQQQIANILGILYLLQHKEIDSDGSAYPPDDGHWDCVQDPKNKKKQICHHYHIIPELPIAIYGTGIYDPSTGLLQLWATSPASGDGFHPVGTPGVQLIVSGTHVEGDYYVPFEVSKSLKLDKMQ